MTNPRELVQEKLFEFLEAFNQLSETGYRIEYYAQFIGEAIHGKFPHLMPELDRIVYTVNLLNRYSLSVYNLLQGD